MLPQLEPGLCARFRRAVDWLQRYRLPEWPNIRSFEHFPYLLNLVN